MNEAELGTFQKSLHPFSYPAGAFWILRALDEVSIVLYDKEKAFQPSLGVVSLDGYRVVKLLKNHIYPTYQLHAFMANKKTSPQDGLRLAALTTLEWLGRRLGENTPDALKDLPSPNEYRTVSSECLASLHLNAGFMIDIVSLPQQGIWTLQITEPDLGPNPGSPQQSRLPVSGRIIETNVAFKIVDKQLECGFKTMISDPEGTAQPAETYRLAIIRQLANNPDFGLLQNNRLTQTCTLIESANQLKSVLSLAHSEDNDLPCVIFTQILRKSDDMLKMEALAQMHSNAAGLSRLGGNFNLPLQPSNIRGSAFPVPAAQKNGQPSWQQATPENPPYDIDTFAKYGISLCRTYLLSNNLLDKLCKAEKLPLSAGDIAVLEPLAFGGKRWSLPYELGKARQDKTMAQLKGRMYSYPCGKEINFGHISFLSAARETLLASTRSAQQEAASASVQWAENLEFLKSGWNAQLKEKDDECHDLRDQLYRQRQYTARIEQEKDDLRHSMQEEKERCQAAIRQKEELITALRRRMRQPTEHRQIADWVKKEFSDRLILHPKAVALLNEKSARIVEVSLICDALDFLATDYWERRYNGINTDEMNRRCSEKYGRPFEVVPTGAYTVKYAPNEYKVKYFPGVKGKPVESSLDYHLKVGNRPDNLLRIYFLHDDKKQLIVVGSLPCHLQIIGMQ